jgi:hypothetical protein
MAQPIVTKFSNTQGINPWLAGMVIVCLALICWLYIDIIQHKALINSLHQGQKIALASLEASEKRSVGVAMCAAEAIASGNHAKPLATESVAPLRSLEIAQNQSTSPDNDSSNKRTFEEAIQEFLKPDPSVGLSPFGQWSASPKSH